MDLQRARVSESEAEEEDDDGGFDSPHFLADARGKETVFARGGKFLLAPLI